MPINIAIDTIINLPENQFSPIDNEVENKETDENLYYELARNFHYGFNDSIIDYDKALQNYNKALQFEEEGFKVIRSSLAEGQNFFEYEPKEHYDIIVSNPPFSKKDKVLKRLYELDKPYAMLLPLAVLQGNSRFKYIKDCEWIGFNKRIGFHTNNDFQKYTKGAAFATGYLCKGILPEKLILERLEEYERELK